MQRDIEYSRAGGERLLLDVYTLPEKGLFPVAILLHGGGWGSGAKAGAEVEVLLPPLMAAGFVVFLVNYRLAPKHRWPAQLEDVLAAIRWVRSHAAQWCGDPQRIALIGYSAGGHLACLAATQNNKSTRVSAVVGLAAPTDLLEDTHRRGGLSPAIQDLLGYQTTSDEVNSMLHHISPLNFIRHGLPPFLLIHGTEDQGVPFQQSQLFQQRLQQDNVICELITVPNAPHGIAKWDTFDQTYKSQMTRALCRLIPPTTQFLPQVM